MKILSVNECNSTNLGDQLISVCTRQIIEKYLLEECSEQSALVQADFTRAELYKTKSEVLNFKTKPSFKDSVKKVIPQKFKWLISRTLKVNKIVSKMKYDTIFIGGGQLILGKNTFPVSLLVYSLLFKVHNKNKKVVLFNVGCADKFSILDKVIIKLALKFVNVTFLRDKQSVLNFNKNFNTENVIKTIDPVFLIDKLNIIKEGIRNERFLVFPASYEEVYLKYNVELSKDEYILYWCNSIKSKNTKNLPVLIMCSDLNQDESISIEIVEALNSSDINFTIKYIEIKSFSEMSEYICSSHSILSARMHPLIIAKSFGVKEIFSYPISNKLVGFENEFINGDGLDESVIDEFIDNLKSLKELVCNNRL